MLRANVNLPVRGFSVWLSSEAGGVGGGRPVVLSGAEHGVEDVDAPSGEADEGGVVSFAFAAFLVVVGPARGVFQGGESGEEQC